MQQEQIDELNDLRSQKPELERLARLETQTNFGAVGPQCAAANLSRLQELEGVEAEHSEGPSVPSIPAKLPPVTLAGHS